jgi:hypothetical protein
LAITAAVLLSCRLPRAHEYCTFDLRATAIALRAANAAGEQNLFEISRDRIALREIVPGVLVDEVRAGIGCNLINPATYGR